MIGTNVTQGVFHLPVAHGRNNRRATLVLLVACACVVVGLALAGWLLWPEAISSDLGAKNAAPGAGHVFGTDQLGRDLFARTISGLAIGVAIGCGAAVVSSVIAVIVGVAAGLGGRRVDAFLGWLIDLMLSIPHLVALILVAFALGKGIVGVSVGIALTHWPSLARVIRAEVMQVRSSRYVAVSRQLGATRLQVFTRHVVRAVFPQFLVGVVLMFPHAILHEAAVTFLGFGLAPETPSIGIILAEASRQIAVGNWWQAVLPGCALIAFIVLIDATGTRLRVMLDPQQSQK
ncbi:ABC transporter permease [Corynebacterium sp. SCR221107]|uniref:ABC transporter permease n=1 Tax=Corynebacterium sp. SCR221107 TaxID=3017361 RepID=UPI0022EC78D7|nr:ABC transporter permease [Corynebacterium sp. SCR221107]WBT08256.1 ABC transporter permease [Corynebacterium sp. SCR221107]